VYGSCFFFFQAEDGIRDFHVTGVQTCALPISRWPPVPVQLPRHAAQRRIHRPGRSGAAVAALGRRMSMRKPPPEGTSLEKLLWVMARLRDPDGGCPWDLEQDFKSIAPYTIEEAYEVADAIDRGDMRDLKEELGDLLLQSVYHAQMATEQDLLDFDDVATAVADKMIARHPHVFSDARASSADDVTAIWDAQKAKEKPQDGDIFAAVTKGLPALLRAQKLQKKAAKEGFTWPDSNAAWEK